MNRNQKLTVEMLDEIDRYRAGQIRLDELEEKLWRLLDATETGFPPIVAGKVDELVLALRRLQSENRYFSGGAAFDENRGSEDIFSDVVGSLMRYLD